MFQLLENEVTGTVEVCKASLLCNSRYVYAYFAGKIVVSATYDNVNNRSSTIRLSKEYISVQKFIQNDYSPCPKIFPLRRRSLAIDISIIY